MKLNEYQFVYIFKPTRDTFSFNFVNLDSRESSFFDQISIFPIIGVTLP